MFIVKDDDGKNDYKRYNSIYFNYFLISYYRVRLFLAMQMRVMAACMESQTDILESTASAQSGRREVTVCFSPMSMLAHEYVVVLLYSFHLDGLTQFHFNNFKRNDWDKIYV